MNQEYSQWRREHIRAYERAYSQYLENIRMPGIQRPTMPDLTLETFQDELRQRNVYIYGQN